MSHNQDNRSYRSVPVSDPTVKTCVRIYDGQSDFSRGVRAMRRQGWALQTFHQTRSPQALDLIQASAPGMIPTGARQQIVAHYACLHKQPAGGHVRRHISRALIALAERIERSGAGEETDCARPCPA